jgi:two-component system heavy metal sensor histidine kinase CusS
MFLKNAKLLRYNSLSLVTKLMLFYSFSTISILAAISLFLYPTLIKITTQLNLTQASHFTTECYIKIIIALLMSSLTAIIFGHLIARKGLNRLHDFEKTMERMTVNSLHERIDLTEWPKELSSLCEKFNTMLDRLQAAFVQLSNFSSDIAHELRTPINNLRGMTEITLAMEQDEKHQKLLEKYMQEYNYLSKLIENLLFFARSDNGQIHLNHEIIHTRTEILNICDYYQAIADNNDILLICEGDANIKADLMLFKRVISNIVSNALRYTPKNGKITIVIKPVNQTVEISILDTGAGIPAEHLSKIFDRFYRVDPSRSSQSGGLGLGLAIVKSIIDLHKGQLQIKSEVNHGTSIHLQLPAANMV